MKKINLDEIRNKYPSINDEDCYQHIIDDVNLAMKEAIKQALELAAENAKTVTWYDAADNEVSEIVDRSSIRNIINQIE